MRVLLLAHAFNSLTQRLFVELRARGEEVSVELDVNDGVTAEAVALFRPDAVLAPYLRRAIPAEVFERVPCLVVHPGPPGDRGPSALDRAILEERTRWGVTVFRATAELDAGPVFASRGFPLREAAKSSIYRHEVTEAAVEAALEALAKLRAGEGGEPPPAGPARPAVRQADRAIDWERDPTALALRKIRSADGSPGVLDRLCGREVHLHDARPEPGLRGRPGALLARTPGGAVCRATADGAVSLGHLRPKAEPALKLPAADVLGEAARELPEVPGAAPDLAYEERNHVGYVSFPFLDGAMSTGRCERLRALYVEARTRSTRAIVLLGGPDFFSNGLHLGAIEAAESPADESWRNIHALDDLVREILLTDDRLTLAALAGNAGAGGVFLALAADRVLARAGVVLNPHYRGMGNLYGSEYWTYVLPRRVGPERAREVAEARLPVGTAEALRLGLVDEVLDRDPERFRGGVVVAAERLAGDPALPARLEEKRRARAADEARKPLERYRAEELERMKLNFYGFDPSYHVARYNFIFKIPKSRTPLYLAQHRRGRRVEFPPVAR